jgi:hypothetical protein
MKYYLLLFFIMLALISSAQNSCPQGYSEKSVKCNGTISIKCVPDNYTCDKCWSIEWQKCDGNWSGGLAWHSSYEKCLEDAEKTKNGTLYQPCPEIMNKYVYRIYIDNSGFCIDNKKENEEKVTSFDGMLIEEVPEDPTFKKKLDESFIRTRKLLNDSSKIKDGTQKIKGDHNTNPMGRRAENTMPKVESMAITVDNTDSVKITPTSHKK